MSLWIQVCRCDLPVIWKLVQFSCWLCLQRLWWWFCQSINGGGGETCFPFCFTLQCIAIHWSAKQSTRSFLLYFHSSVSLSSAFETVADVSLKKMLEQWQLYRRLLCDVLGTSMISAHLHCSWLLHFVKSLHLLCTNSGMFFYQGIHMCVSVCLCVVFISPVSSVEVVRAKRAYCCVYLKNWIHSLHIVLLVFCKHIKSKRLSENFFL